MIIKKGFVNSMKSNFITHKEVLNEMLKDKNFKKEYDALAPRYEIVSKAIEMRLKNKMTQEDVARKIGTTKSNISRFESGNYNPTIDFLIKLSDALGKHLKVSMV